MVVPTSSHPSRFSIDLAAGDPGTAPHTATSRVQMLDTTRSRMNPSATRAAGS
jgi:hypothetical protein